jgi:hypothetical protein
MHVNQLPTMKGRLYRAILGPAHNEPLTPEQQAQRNAAQEQREQLTWERHWARTRAERIAASIERGMR